MLSSALRTAQSGRVPRRSSYNTMALTDLAANQDRVVTQRQLFGLGVSWGTLSYRVRTEGPWQAILPGVVLTHNGTPTRQERARAALLYAGEDAVLTGAESLRRWGARAGSASSSVEVLIPLRRRRRSVGFVIVERTRRLPHVQLRAGLPCAPVPRAVIDHSRRLTEVDPIRALVAEAVQRRMCTDVELFAELRAAQTRGTQAVRLVMAEIVAGVRSVAEAKSRVALRDGGVPQPQWNLDLFTEDGKFLAAPDGWWPQQAVALEINSREWHLEPRGWALTQARWQRLTALGILVIPVTPGQIASDPAGFVQTVRDTLAAAGRRPLPRLVAVMRSQRAS